MDVVKLLNEGKSAAIKKQPNYVDVDSLRPGMRGLDMIVKVISKDESREVRSRRNGSTHNVAEALVGDETGCVILTLWDDQISMLEEGDVIEIRNGHTSLFKGFLRLKIGRHGKVQKLDKEVGEVNKENNLSERRQVSFNYWI